MARPTDTQRRANLRMAWVLAAVAALFGAGFVLKMTLLHG
jgi:hypothetical protein